MSDIDTIRAAMVVGVSRPRPSCQPERHDDIVFTFMWPKKTGLPFPVRELAWHPAADPARRYLLGVTRVNAKVYIAATEIGKSATMVADAIKPDLISPAERTTTMPAVELSPRQTTALLTVKSEGPCTAKVVAEAIQPGSDSRGAAQTLRRMISDFGYFERTDKGCYKITAKGRSAANRILKAQESGDTPTGDDSEPQEPSVD